MPAHPSIKDLLAHIPPQSRLLGLDYGRVRIGLAMGDFETRLATPFEVYTRRTLKQDVAHIRGLMGAENIGGLVVGWPCHMDGQKSALAQATQEFMLNFERISGPVDYIFWDERLSSSEATALRVQIPPSKPRGVKGPLGNVDALAAALVLQSALDALLRG